MLQAEKKRNKIPSERAGQHPIGNVFNMSGTQGVMLNGVNTNGTYYMGA
jgi:hypothetical protein